METLKFIALFTLLTTVYLLLGRWPFIPLVAKVRGKTVKEYVKNEDTWFWVFLGATLVTLGIACFNWGPAVLLPEDFPKSETRQGVKNFFSNLWTGEDAKAVEATPPWAKGTWFWWVAFLLYLPFTALYGCWAFSDNIIKLAANYRRRKREREKREMEHEEEDEHEEEGGKKAKSKHRTHTTAHDSSHFWKPDAWDLISMIEMIARFLSQIFNRKK